MNKKTDREHCMDRIDHIVSYLFSVITWVAIIAAVYLAVITTVNVLLRWIAGINIMSAIETSQLALAVVALCSMPAVSLFNGHIKVDLLVSTFSPKKQDFMTGFNLLICSGMMIILGYFTLEKAEKAMNMGTYTTVLHFPYWPVYAVIGIMLIISGICCIYNIIHLIVTGKTVESDTFEKVREKFKGKKDKCKEEEN